VNAVEIFAGAGGAALGLHRAGWHHSLLVEWDEHAAATLKAANLGPVHCGDVREVDWSPYRDTDLLWASPPCQAWSTAGSRRGAQDERNGWPWTFDVVDALGPTWLVCENVPGLLHHSRQHHPDPQRCAGCYWERWILPEARRRFAWVGVWRLNAADYGVPQIRRRVFIVCGPSRVSKPAPTHGDPMALSGLFSERQPWVTVREALGITVAKVATASRPVVSKDERELQDLTDRPSVAVSSLSSVSAGGAMVALDPRHPPAIPDQPAPTLRSGGAGHSAPPMWLCTNDETGLSRKPDTAPAATIGGAGNAYLTNRPSPTNANPRDGIGGSAGRDLLDRQIGRRRLAPEECAILQGFPPDHPWRGTKTSIYRQIGNAVPPPLAEAIGRAILEAP
jgi:DNA (cytosine-5)-methyltransferase 1